MEDKPTPTFFPTPADFRAWLLEHHAQKSELLVGFYKKDTGIPSITWPESVDQALCFGWIDGVRRSIDASAYSIRFTPRKPKSIWSAVNINRVEELTNLGLMQPTGLAAFEKRDDAKSKIYAYEQKNVQLSEEFAAIFEANAEAWTFFQTLPPSYQRPALWWVMSAKQEATQRSRLATLIADSTARKRIKQLDRTGGQKKE
jgi:uncharacterized protein YdeI (YjbR/CyaY-like superfamily)